MSPGYVRYITAAAAKNDNDSNRIIEFGILEGTTFTALEGTNENDSDFMEWIVQKTHVFHAGERPAFKYSNAVVGTTCIGIMEGYEVKIEEAIELGFK